MLVATAVYVLAVVGAAIALLIAQGSTRRGFTRRFGAVMGTWGAVFAVGLAVGTTRYPHDWGFWLAMAALVVVPCLVGAWRELPR